MANHSYHISGITGVLIFLASSVVASAECVDGGLANPVNFFEHGIATDGAFVLSLALPQNRVIARSAALVDLQLSVVDNTQVDLFRDAPRGTYDVEVDTEGSGKRQPVRDGYLVHITQVAVEHLSPQCPTYETLNLNDEYNLEPGRYVVRASRKLLQLKSWKPYRTQQRSTVVSNDVTLDVVP